MLKMIGSFFLEPVETQMARYDYKLQGLSLILYIAMELVCVCTIQWNWNANPLNVHLDSNEASGIPKPLHEGISRHKARYYYDVQVEVSVVE